ncbi:MerR family transcriptional regulator [Comamonas sp. J-3]|uniref:MerR family transcriptional regulator n=1 Tax=Comamonas trifloxystrobinivorans TaxID=3350256 RepID=UPI00372A0BDB
MSHYSASIHTTTVEILDDGALDAATLARACHRSVEWVQARVVDGVITPSTGTRSTAALTSWRFSSTAIVRARRVAQLEHMYDADPQLAAMTVDLMEEVLELRRKLRQL